MKKVLQIVPYYAPHLGGVETHVSRLNRELLRLGFEIKVITTQHDPHLALSEHMDGVEVIRLPKSCTNKKLSTWSWMWQHRDLLLDADVIHIHDVVWWLYPFIPFVRSKLFATFHGWEGVFPVPLKNKLQRRLNAFAVKRHLNVGAWIEKWYGDSPDGVTYGAVDKNDSALSTKIRLNLQEIRIVFIGRLEAVNEMPSYLELVQTLKNSGVSVTITWVGEGSYRLACLAYGTVTGMVQDVGVYLKDADIVFATSYLSILEAQLREKIVVALYSNSVKKSYLETFPGAEYMITAPDPVIAFDSLLTLFRSSVEAQRLSKDARSYAQKQTWKKVCDLYVDLWSL